MRYLTRAALIAFLASPAAVALLAPGCGSGSNSTTNSSNTGGAGGSGSGTGAGLNASGSGAGMSTSSTMSTGSTMSTSSTMTGGGPCVPVACNGHIYECGDCLDNDGDGKIDSEDPDCLGPCDNTENSYYGGIPGQNNAGCKMDCYFDQDTGAGNDDCYWDHRCDPHETDPNYYPEHDEGNKCEYNSDPNFTPPASPFTCSQMYNTQSTACHDYCGPLTPNGCDCFGCCELPQHHELVERRLHDHVVGQRRRRDGAVLPRRAGLRPPGPVALPHGHVLHHRVLPDGPEVSRFTTRSGV